MSRRCPRGGTHVWPHAGKSYDDGRCLKCGAPTPDATGFEPLRTGVLWRLPDVHAYWPVRGADIVVIVARCPAFDLMTTISAQRFARVPMDLIGIWQREQYEALRLMHTALYMPGHE